MGSFLSSYPLALIFLAFWNTFHRGYAFSGLRYPINHVDASRIRYLWDTDGRSTVGCRAGLQCQDAYRLRHDRPPSKRRNVSPASSSRLYYRALDSNDDTTDASMLKVQTRAPPGFDMKTALQPPPDPSSSSAAEGGSSPTQKPTALNKNLIRALILNQVLYRMDCRRSQKTSRPLQRMLILPIPFQYLILGLATVVFAVKLFAFDGFEAFSRLDSIMRWTGSGPDLWDLSLSVNRLAWGIGGALPLLAVSNWIENSDKASRTAYPASSLVTMLMENGC